MEGCLGAQAIEKIEPKNDAIVMSQITSPIPVNVITGFLGVGKTSSILKLLEQKPADQEWAILVNEFGEIGVDRGLVQGQLAPRNDVMVFEVPGGCMCCAAGLPMEMALSQIFFLGEPDRLIIEPTGLGHPAEVLGGIGVRGLCRSTRAPHHDRLGRSSRYR